MTDFRPTSKLLASSLTLLAAALVGCETGRPTAPLSYSSFQRPALAPQVALPATSAAPTTRPTLPSVALRQHPAAPLPSAVQATGAPLGGYKTLGGIVAEVNGNPIYANKVLRQITPALSARAAEMDEQQFKALATNEIRDRIRDLVRAELLFGAAERILSAEDRKIAETLTMQDRSRRITEAGGSVELARRRAADDGEDFDELILDTYRQKMSEVFRYRKIRPRIQVSGDDMRNYYNANLQTIFTQQDEVTVRIIQINPRRYRTKADAQARAQEIQAKAQAPNADFAELARTGNDDPNLARTGGQFTLQRGAYRYEKVEQALWSTPVGQITPIIEDTGGFFIALVESRKEGKTMPFEDVATQNRIFADLSSRQQQELIAAIERTQVGNSAIVPERPREDIVIDMAMQNYPLWAQGVR